MNVEVGQRLRLKQHVGYQPEIDPNDELEQFRNRHHPLFAGQVGEVKAIAPHGEEDHAFLLFDHHELVNHTAGKAEPEHVVSTTNGPRHVSFTQAQLDDWFEAE